MSSYRPFLAIPIGEPAGIGPEIVMKALADPEVVANSKCVIIGDIQIVRYTLDFLGMQMKINLIESPEEGDYSPGIINLINISTIDMNNFVIGEISGMCGNAAFQYIKKSIELAMEKKVAAVVTPPINKEALKAGGVDYIGHTEIFGALTNTADPLTMFEVRNLRVFFLSRHVSLKKACDMVVKERIIDYTHRCYEALAQLGMSNGKMAIAGLNPHSGEHGLFGDEEVEEVMPAIEALQEEGYNVEGPIGADSVFHLALIGRYDCVLSLYHDQGHIATKTLDFERTISLTLGMPILRTSVDHGTAMDIAGKGIASATSMIEAIRLGNKYAKSFN
jgi:4-hydroxythreonine-4-phosphate dehydrogenase